MIKLDEIGVEQIRSIIREYEEKIRILNKVKGDAVNLDKNIFKNSGLDFAKNEHASLQKGINNLQKELNNVELVRSHGDSNRVDLYDVVTIYDKLNDDEYQVLLTGKYEPKQSQSLTDIDEITLNSPLGEVIYGQPKGAKVSYSVRERKFNVEIKDFSKSASMSNSVETEKTNNIK